MPKTVFDGWVGVDLDRTLAVYPAGDKVNDSPDAIGAPIEPMRQRVLSWLRAGLDVRLMTARWSAQHRIPGFAEAWAEWSAKNLDGRVLPLQSEKNYDMFELWDDRAVRVFQNTGLTLEDLIMNRIDQISDVATAEELAMALFDIKHYVGQSAKESLLGY